ncbi:MAG TPA: hypothetical protein VFE40_07475 [Jatrophihabitantaceae bacterium]|jgi:hypothetical protein|nr:hypothetical protein [Jatrophihabitantaceae bacterium]
MAFVIVVAVVLALACAAWVDHRDRKHHRKQRSSGDMIGRRRERILNFRSTPEPGVPVSDDWDQSMGDRLRDQDHGGY